MTRPKKRATRLIVDTDVAASARAPDSPWPRAKHCRDLLDTILSVCHHVMLPGQMGEEWRRHVHGYAFDWLRIMNGKKKAEFAEIACDEELRARLLETATTARERKAMEKDLHLIEVAIAADGIIFSLDEEARELFARAAGRVGELRDLVWINPERTPIEEVGDWFRRGRKPPRRLTLGFHDSGP